MQESNEIFMDEFNIEERYHDDFGNLCYNITPKELPICCPKCGSIDFVKNGNYQRQIKDLPSFDEHVYLELLDKRYLCKDCNKSFVPEYKSIDINAKLTSRLKRKIQKDALNETLIRVAVDNNIGSSTVYGLLDEYVEELEKNHKIYAPKILGIDEAHLNNVMRCVYVDINNNGIFDMQPVKSYEAVYNYFCNLPGKEEVKVVTMDMCPIYRKAAYDALPNAVVVVDRFHVMKMIINILDNERIKLSKQYAKSDKISLKSTRSSLLKNFEKLNNKQLEAYNQIIEDYPSLKIIHDAKELFRDIYNSKTRDEATKKCSQWKDLVRKTPELSCYKSVFRTLESWWLEIFNYFEYRYTNGPTESVNGLIKTIEKMGKGYSFRMLRARVLFGTSATKQYYKQQTKKKPDNIRYGYSMFVDSYDIFGVEKIEYSYVDIDELSDILKKDLQNKNRGL